MAMLLRQWGKVTRFLIPASLLACVAAWFVMFLEVETVVVSGPILFLVGVVIIIGSRRLSFRLGVLIGVAQVLIVLLFDGLVIVLNWGPSAAEKPFRIMGAIYVLILFPVSLRAWDRVPRGYKPGECEGCGYLLYGLREPRC